MRTSITTARLALAGAVAFTVLGGPLLTLRANAVHDDAAQTAAAAAPAPAVPQTTANDAGGVPQGDAGAADDAVSHDPSEPALVDDELPPATAVAEPTRPDGDDVPQDDVAEAAPGSDEDEPGVPSSPTPDDAESAAEVSAPVVTSVAPTGPAVDEATPAASLTDDGTLPLKLSLDGCTVSVGVAPSVPVGALLTLEDSWTYQFQGSVQPGQALTFVLGAHSQIDPSTGYAVQAHLTAPGGYDELAARAFDVTACINSDAEMASLQALAEATGDPPDNDVAVDIFSAPDCNGDQAYFVTSVTIDYGTFAVLDVPATDLCISPERLTEADSVDVVGGTSVSFGPDLQASRTIVVAWPLAPKPAEPPVSPTRRSLDRLLPMPRCRTRRSRTRQSPMRRSPIRRSLIGRSPLTPQTRRRANRATRRRPRSRPRRPTRRRCRLHQRGHSSEGSCRRPAPA